MYRIGKERLKTYILLVLIAASIIQVGILWDYQSHGFPTNFLTAFFNGLNSADEDSPETARKEYFQPYRIVVSNGDETHWPIDRNDTWFPDLWKEASYYFTAALESKPTLTLPAEEWGNLVKKKTIVYEFKSQISTDLLKWFLDKPNTEPEFTGGVFKMAVAPWDDINDFNTVYIMNENQIYRYTIKFNVGGWKREDYTELVEFLGGDSKYAQRTFRVYSENDPHGSLPSIDRDILFATYPARYRSFYKLTWDIPENVSNLAEMAGIILGSEMTSFHRSKDMYDTIVFKTNERLYRVYSDGLLEYKYIPGSQQGDRKGAGDAFLNAFKFVNRIEKHMVSGADIYLAGMIEGPEGVFEFTFDYMVEDMPVVMDLDERGNDALPVRHAIVIKSDGRRVLECRWVFKDFANSGRSEEYSVFIEDMGSDFSLSSLEIDDIYFSYVVEADSVANKEPSLVIEKPSGDIVDVPMRRRGVN